MNRPRSEFCEGPYGRRQHFNYIDQIDHALFRAFSDATNTEGDKSATRIQRSNARKTRERTEADSQLECRYVNPTNASSARLNPASTTKFLRRAWETAQRLPIVLSLSSGCEKCHISPEIMNFPREWEIDSVCPNCARRTAPCTCSASIPFVSK